MAEKRELATGEIVNLLEDLFEKCYTEEEFMKLLDGALESRKKCERLRNYCLIGLGGWCSCRTSETLGVRACDILPNRILKIPTLKQKGKDKGQLRLVPIQRELFHSLLRYIDENKIKQKDRLFPMSLDALEQRIKTVCKNKGVKYKGYKGLRHRFCTYFAHAYKMTELAKLSGHKDPKTLLIYYHPNPETLKETYDEAAEGEIFNQKKKFESSLPSLKRSGRS